MFYRCLLSAGHNHNLRLVRFVGTFKDFSRPARNSRFSSPSHSLTLSLVIIIFLIQLLNSWQKLLSLALKSRPLSAALLLSFSLSLRALESSRQPLHGADTTSLTPQEANALCYFRCPPVDVNMNIGRERGRGRRRRSRRRRGSSLNNFLHIPRQR